MEAKITIPIAQVGNKLVYGIVFVPLFQAGDYYLLDVKRCGLVGISLDDALNYVVENQGEIKKQIQAAKMWQ